jgi:hypothetical protein
MKLRDMLLKAMEKEITGGGDYLVLASVRYDGNSDWRSHSRSAVHASTFRRSNFRMHGELTGRR